MDVPSWDPPPRATGYRKSGSSAGLNLENASDMPRSRFCRSGGHAPAASAAHPVRPGAKPTSRHVARDQPAAARHEGVHYELRVLSVRMDALGSTVSRSGV